jgi:hypothetical protein
VLAAGISLIDQVLPRTSADWLASGHQPTGWWLLTESLRLWLLWENDPLVAERRHDVLTWYLSNSCRPCMQQAPPAPSGFREFCQILAMLGEIPLDLFSIPCTGTFGDAGDSTQYLPPPTLPAHLNSLVALFPGDTTDRKEASLRMSYDGQVVAIASLLEYVEDTYGREKLSALLAAFGVLQRWDTLVPAVFGISAEEFEAGWRTYLEEHYAVPEPWGIRPK